MPVAVILIFYFSIFKIYIFPLPCSRSSPLRETFRLPSFPPRPLRAESREGWGAGGFQSRNTLLGSDARLERARGRLEGEPIALKMRNQQTRPRPTAWPASARPRRDGGRLNLDRPTAEAPAPEPPALLLNSEGLGSGRGGPLCLATGRLQGAELSRRSG